MNKDLVTNKDVGGLLRHRLTFRRPAGRTFFACLEQYRRGSCDPRRSGCDFLFAARDLSGDCRACRDLWPVRRSIKHSGTGVLPGGALDVIRDQMNLVASQGSSKLGVTFLIGFAVSLWSANAGIKSIFDALNLVYNESEKRGLIGLNLVSLAFTVAAIVFVLLAIGCIAALPAISTNQLQGPSGALIVQIGRWPVLFVVVAFGLALVYRFGPSRRKPQWRWVSWGRAFAGVAWIAVSILFSWYAAKFGSYNKTYGSLAAIIVFMVWMWLSTAVILIGAELDAEMEHQTARDTTTGRRKPLGSRGATMADTVGPAQD